MKKAVVATWDVNVSPTGLRKLINGHYPRDMEDRWFCYSEIADPGGRMLVHLGLSWTGCEQAILTASVARNSKGEIQIDAGAKIISITWETEGRPRWQVTEAEAKREAWFVCEEILGCDLTLCRPTGWWYQLIEMVKVGLLGIH